MYTKLNPTEIIKTARRLERRIQERFPGSGLSKVALEVGAVAESAAKRAASFGRINWGLRGTSVLLIAGVIGTLGWVLFDLKVRQMSELQDFISFLEAASGAAVFLGAAIFFLWSLEAKLKRQRAVKALYELRVLAHIVDMHQLTKDPERIFFKGPDTESSPARTMTTFEMSRYLDYCSELLSLLSKIGAIYAQGNEDPPTLDAVDQIESLTTGLSRKIWQKLVILKDVVITEGNTGRGPLDASSSSSSSHS